MNSPKEFPMQPKAAATAKKSRLRPRRSMHALESRIVFDGAAAVDALAQANADAAIQPDAPIQPDAVAPVASARSEIVFVESNVADYQTLLNGVTPGAEVHVLDASQDGLAQIAGILGGRSGIDALHIISHGSQGSVQLGGLSLTAGNLQDHAADLATIGGALDANADILLYGCSVAAGSDGAAFISALAQASQADIAASTDLTGAVGRGGNWQLEANVGTIETDTAALGSALDQYTSLLPTLTVTSGVDTGVDASFGVNLAADQADGGGLSLREAMNWATDGDTIELATNVTLAGDLSIITKTLIIDGKGHTVNGYATATTSYTGFDLQTAGKTLTLQNATFTGFADFSNIVNINGANLNVYDSVFSMDSNPGGFAVYLAGSGTWNLRGVTIGSATVGGVGVQLNGAGAAQTGSVSISDSLIYGLAEGVDIVATGGASYNATLTNTTIVDNTTGIYTNREAASSSIINITFNNSISKNTTEKTDGSGAVTPVSNNSLSGVAVNFVNAAGHDYRLASNAANAINLGLSTNTNTTDVRGMDRTRQGAVDIGAYESQYTAGGVPNTGPALDLNGGTAGQNHTISVATNAATNVSIADVAATITQSVDSELHLTGLTVALTGALDGGSETLSLTASQINAALGYGITVSGNSTATLTLAGGSLLANYQTVLRQIVYSDVAGSPTAGARTITVTGTDDVSGTPQTTTLTITAPGPATPSTPDMTAGTDSGSSSTDNITNDTTPDFTITGTTNNSTTVTLFNDANNDGIVDAGESLGTAAGNGGSVTITASALAGGTYNIKSIQTDATGTSSASSALAITIDATAPNAPSAPDMTAGTDSGVDTDNITSDTTPTFSGTAEADSTVTLYDTDGTTVLGTATATGGNWSITSSALSAGAHTLTAKATDAAGNVSVASAGLAITIDATAPNAPSAPDMTAGTDSGVNTDNITSDTTPTFTGTAEADSTVTLYDTDGTTVLGTATATGGNWSITTSVLSAGAHTLTAKATDAAGNVSVASAGLAITIDTTAPNAPSAPDMTAGTDSGVNTDNLTSDTTPTFSGTAEADSTVTLYDTDGTTVLGTATATGGNWSITSSALSAGAHTVTAKATDAAGNVSVASTGLAITMDATAPNAPSAPDMTAGTDSGVNTDNITSDTTPTFTGTAEADSTVTLYDTDGTTVLGTATATGGNWSITSSALSAGAHTLTAKATDAAGNVSVASAGLAITIDTTGPTVSDARIGISGASGSGGAYKIGDTVTATWDNTGTGDNNADTINGVTVNFSAFGGGVAVAATDNAGTWTATYIIISGAIDGTNKNVSVTATDNAGNATTTADTSNATVDNQAPTVTDGNISISGASGTGGAFKIGDTVTATWNNTAGGDNNTDTISGVTVDFSAFGGGAAVAATDNAGTWTATYTLVTGAANGTNKNVSVTATDDAGNATTTADTSNATADTTAPAIANAVASQAVNDNATLSPFATMTFTEANNVTVQITLDAAAKGALSNLGSGAYDAGTGVYTYTGTAANATTAIQGLVFTPTANRVAPGSTETTTFTVLVTDTAGNSVSDATTTVVSTSINDAPVLDAGQSPALAGMGINPAAPSNGSTTGSTLVSALVAGITDADSGAVQGIAVTAIDTGSGTLYYSTDGGTTWAAAGAVSDASALLLASDANTRLYYQSGNSVSGDLPSALTFRAWDQTSGTAGNKVDTTTNGTTTAFSTVTDTVSIAIFAPPTIGSVSAGQAVNDTATISPFAATTIANSEGNNVTVTVTLDTQAKGSFTTPSGFTDNGDGSYTLTNVTAGAAQSAIQGLVFTPAANRVNPTLTETTTFTVTVTDVTTTVAATDSTTTVVSTSVNDAPAVGGATAVTNIDDTATATPFSTFTISDADTAQSQTLTVTLDAAAKGALSNLSGGAYNAGTGIYTFTGTAAQAQAAIRGLVFTPTANRVNPTLTETTTFTVSVNDAIAAAATDATTTVVATSVNDAPTVGGATAVSNLNVGVTASTSPFSAFTVTDADTAQTQTVTVTLDTAAKGTLSNLGGGAYDAGTGEYTFTGTAAQAQAAIRALVFTPTVNRVATGATETTTFTVSVNDGIAAAASDNTTTVVVTNVPPPVVTPPPVEPPPVVTPPPVEPPPVVTPPPVEPPPVVTPPPVEPPPVVTPPPVEPPPVVTPPPPPPPVVTPPAPPAPPPAPPAPPAPTPPIVAPVVAPPVVAPPPPVIPISVLPDPVLPNPVSPSGTISQSSLVVDNGIGNLSVGMGQNFTYVIPKDAFLSSSSDARLSFKATQANGAPLPNWLRFNPETGTFSGVVPEGEKGDLRIRVKAVDSKGNEAVTTFTIKSGVAARENGNQPEDGSKPENNEPRQRQRGAALSGQGLLSVLGVPGFSLSPDAIQSDALTVRAAEQQADAGEAVAAEAVQSEADAHAPQLSAQLQREAQRFGQAKDATLRHLAAVEQARQLV